MHAKTRVETLHDFLKKQEIDVLFLREVSHPNICELHGYREYTNIGTSMRSTTIVTRDEMHLTNINFVGPSNSGRIQMDDAG